MWSVEQVAARFEEAVDTADRLPGVRVQGFFNTWPQVMRERWAGYADDRPRRLPPSPEAIDRMEEVHRWVLWQEETQRHLVWMRAERRPWKEVCGRLGCSRATANRRWKSALLVIASELDQLSATKASRGRGAQGAQSAL